MKPEKDEKRQGGLAVKTGVTAGYWTCEGVKGTPDRRGVIWKPQASHCWK